MQVQKADVIESNVLGTRIDGVVSTSVYNKVVVFVPILEYSGTVHNSGTGRST